MIDSKSMIWLGSFFSLLLIVFCVSKHLDDLNPQIANIDTSNRISTDNTTKATKPDITLVKVKHKEKQEPNLYTKDVVIEDISWKNQNDDKKDLEVDTLHFEPKDRVKNRQNITDVKPTKLQNKKEVKKSKVKKFQKKAIKKEPKKIAIRFNTSKIIESISLPSSQIKRLQIGKEVSLLNKLGFKFSLHKGRFIIIKSSNIKVAKLVKSYLKKRSIPASSIIIKDNNKRDGLELILKERR